MGHLPSFCADLPFMSFPLKKKKFKASGPIGQGSKKKKKPSFYIKGQVVNILGFESHTVSVPTPQLSALGAQKQPSTIRK